MRRWVQDKKAGWHAGLTDPQMLITSTLLEQTHHAIDRKLCMMKGFHHPKGSQQASLRKLAHLYNLVPYQQRAQHASQCRVKVEGGTVPTRDWCLNLQILTSGRLSMSGDPPDHAIGWNVVWLWSGQSAPLSSWNKEER